MAKRDRLYRFRVDRAEVSRRLKAARALAGIKVTELAAREPLRANGITANLIGETERQERDARPMELRVIAEALDLPAWFFTAELRPPTPEPSDGSAAAQIVARLDALGTLLEHIDKRLDAVVAAAEANVTTSDQLGVLQAQMIEVRSQLNLPWRAEGADERPDEPESSRRASAS
jgi:transcriptional regulator with XRE-family HTH domain